MRFVRQLHVADLGPADKVLVVCDYHTASLLPSGSPEPLVIEAEEAQKGWRTVELVIDAAYQAGLDRSSCIIAIGGGVLCDVVAFAASIYLRGIALVLSLIHI